MSKQEPTLAAHVDLCLSESIQEPGSLDELITRGDMRTKIEKAVVPSLPELRTRMAGQLETLRILLGPGAEVDRIVNDLIETAEDVAYARESVGFAVGWEVGKALAKREQRR